MPLAAQPNFFYTRTLGCDLWFLDKKKSKAHQDKVLMLDARSVYRKVTRKIYDFSPEQLQNLLSIVWLYRGEPERFRALVANHLAKMREEATAFPTRLNKFLGAVDALVKLTCPFLTTLTAKGAHSEPKRDFDDALQAFRNDAKALGTAIKGLPTPTEQESAKVLTNATKKSAPVADSSRDLAKQADHVFKVLDRLLDVCEKELDAKEHDAWDTRNISRACKACDEARHSLVEQLRQVRYFHRHAVWLVERFPDGILVDVAGLVKLVSRKEIENNDWSLTPGRYVGIAPEEIDEDFDFEDAIKDIHVELEGLNEEAVELAATIAKNFKELIG